MSLSLHSRSVLGLNGRISWFPRARGNPAPGEGAVAMCRAEEKERTAEASI